MKTKLFFLLILSCFSISIARCQLVEKIYKPFIATAQLHAYGNQQGLPIYILNSQDRMQLEFDDLEGSLKNYYYSYQLCDYNWQPVNLSPFDYMKGFTMNRISTYRYSSLAYTRYTHYQAILPDRNAAPTHSGNYLLKVFLDGDTSKLAFTKQLLVLDIKSTVAAEIVQPFSAQYFPTHQRVNFNVLLSKDLNAFSASQQVKAVILQNNRWDNSQRDILPTFVRGNTLDYTSEFKGLFAGGKEWRWLDLRSFRLQSDRVENAIYNKNSTEIFLKPDVDRRAQRYVYFPDYDGMYQISTYETINPYWQGDYATVHFYFATADGKPYDENSLYLNGAFTNYDTQSGTWKMKWNEQKLMYECTAFLKQGYYNYEYVLKNEANPEKTQTMEGNYWETENMYAILIYYKSFTDRADQLIGIGQLNSRKDRPGFSF